MTYDDLPVDIQHPYKLEGLGVGVQGLVDLSDDPVKQTGVDELDQGIPRKAGL